MNTGEYRSHQCGKKAKGQTDAGEWLCGIHLGAYNRVKKNRAAEQVERDRNKEIKDDTSRILAELTERYGLEGRVFSSYYGTYKGEILVDAVQLQGILNMLSTPFDPATTLPTNQLTEASKWYRHHRNPRHSCDICELPGCGSRRGLDMRYRYIGIAKPHAVIIASTVGYQTGCTKIRFVQRIALCRD